MQLREARWVNCFLCNELVERPSDSGVQEIGVSLGDERELHFWAHLDCMRRVASPDFRFPSDEDIEENRRWLEELEDEDSADDFGREASE
jgi:hypothetical protein